MQVERTEMAAEALPLWGSSRYFATIPNCNRLMRFWKLML